MGKEFTTIKLARRLAERLLENESCRVIIEKASSKDVFVTQPGILNGKVRIPNEGIIVPVEDITRIEYTNRFGCTSWMEVNWF